MSYVLTMILLTGAWHDTEAASVHTQEYTSLAACRTAGTVFESKAVGRWRFMSTCTAK